MADKQKFLDDVGLGIYDGLIKGKIDKVDTKVGDVTQLDTIAKTDLVSAVNEVRNAVSAGGTSAAITIDTGTTTEGMLKSYTIKQGENTVGTIDIPKELVTTSGEVVINPEGQAEGTYIKLVIANQTDPLYINVGTLVDIYKAKENATQIQLTVDNASREISAVIVAGSVGTAELADGSISTVKIADANVTLAKLATDVTDKIDEAKKAGTDAATAVTTLENGKVADNTTAITEITERVETLETQFEAITEDEINALFA